MRMHFAVKVILAVILLISLLLHSAVYIGRDLAADWLLDQGAEYAGIERLRIGWLSGEVRLEGVDIRTPGQRDLKLESLYLKVDLAALTEQRVWIRQLKIDGLYGDITEHREGEHKGALQIGPVLIPAAAEEPVPEEDTGSSEWQVGISRLSISQLDWKTDLPAQQHHLVLAEAGLEGLYFWDSRHASALNLAGSLNGSDFSVGGDVVALAEDKFANLKLTLAPLALQAFTSEAVPGLKGSLSTDLTVHLKLSGDDINLQQTGLLKLEGFSWQSDGVDVQQQAVSWQGQIDAAVAGGGLKDARLDGAIKGSQTQLKLGDVQQADLQALSWKGKIDATMESLQHNGALQLDKLRWQDTGLDVQQQQLSWNGGLTVKLPEQQLQRLQLDGKIAGSGTQVEQGSALQLALQALNWQGSVALDNSVKAADGGAEAAARQDVSVTGESLQLDGLKVHNRKLSSDLLTLAKVSLQKLTFAQQSGSGDDGMRVQLGETLLSGIVAQHKKPLSNISSLQLRELAYDSRGDLSISKVTLRDSQNHVVIARGGKPAVIDSYLDALSGLGGESGEPAAEAADTKNSKQQTSAGPAMRVRIGEIALAGKNQVLFTDNNADPAFKGDILIKSASLKQLDTASKKFSPFTADVELKPFTRLKLSGKTNLAGGGGDADWNAVLTQLELPRLSPYAIENIGYFIENGQLELTSKGTLRNEQIEGENNIVINRLSVDPVNQDKVAGFTKQLSMPLGTAIMILQDDDDNIELDVPISGSLSDPDFGLDSVVKILAGKGLKQAAFSFLAKSLQPYGALISLAEAAVDAASDGSFINLEPVAFTPGSAQLNKTARDYLGKVESMLKERKGMRLNICGQAVSQDAALLNAQLLEANAQRAEPLTEEQLAAELKTQLTALAQSRNDSVKRELSKQVSGERLFVCFALPKLDDPKALPVATLGL
ncbi:DUF748 domain-containing protein [Aliamphritea hakodatensis]|uniref:DUF748 domain-containing protein n=1 Tax=Aliamphritea hakodatensis TaxID=2895352 RepID=UPI0022FD7203|nr:DUF748 domain-containing protein [Aliamphritea hakodatensis]